MMTIAVLPFENLSADPAVAFFSDGVHDAITDEASVDLDLGLAPPPERAPEE